jgi:hypothetical protein
MNTRQQTRGNQPDSPATKKMKLQDRTIHQLACKEILKIKVEIGGRLTYGYWKTILEKYSTKGFICVTRQNLRYRMEMM